MLLEAPARIARTNIPSTKINAVTMVSTPCGIADAGGLDHNRLKIRVAAQSVFFADADFSTRHQPGIRCPCLSRRGKRWPYTWRAS